jgi:hypothetical protein
VVYKLIKTNKNTDEIGIVEGKVCYPSNGVPDGYILAKNVKTNKIKEIYFGGASTPDEQKFSESLDEGTYVFAYRPMLRSANSTYDGPYGFFTCNSIKEGNNCSDPKSHQLIEIEIEKNKTVNGVDICDYYYEKDKPNF